MKSSPPQSPPQPQPQPPYLRLTPPSRWSLLTLTAVTILCMSGIPSAKGVGVSEFDYFHTTCGINNPVDSVYGHQGITVNSKDRVIDNVRVCSRELVDLGSSVIFIRVEVYNTTETGLPCDSSIQLFVGEADDPSSMQRMCGPISYSKVFPGSVLIQLKGDQGSDVTDMDVMARLEEVEYLKKCNRTFYQDEETIVIDRHINPDEYIMLPYNCRFDFNTPSRHNRFVVNVQTVDLKGPNFDTQGCQDNGLAIIDGWELDHNKMFETCNNNTIFTATSSTNYIIIAVKISDPGQADMVFNISVTPFSLTQCYGQVLTLTASSDSQYLTSPGYPDEYYTHLNCLWKIESSDGYEIEIVFEDLDLNTVDCGYDYIDVYDGPSQSSMILATECHEYGDAKRKYRSSGQAFLIRFKANDMKTRGRGFKLRYYTQEQPSIDLVPDTICRENTVHLKATPNDQFLTSVGFPTAYPPNSMCQWEVESANGDDIEVEIVDLDLESSWLCHRDALDIYGSTDTDVSPIASVCSDLDWNKAGTKFRSDGRKMLIRFSSDGSIQRKGFRMRYYTKAVPSSDLADVVDCRGKIVYLNSSDEIQNLTSPGYPGTYQNLSDCRWQIVAPPGNKTKVDIVYLDTDSSYINFNCQVDFVKFFDGPAMSSPSLGQFCKGTHSLVTTGRYLTVQFRTDDEETGKGFMLRYSTPSVGTGTKDKNKNKPKDAATTNTASLALSLLATIIFLLAR